MTNYIKSRMGLAALGFLGTAAAALPASADLTVVQTTKISAPGIQQMLSRIPESQRQSLAGMVSPILNGNPWVTTTYLQGSRVRTDMGQSTVVANAVSGKQFTLDNATRKYSIGAYNPFQKAAGTFSCVISPTGVTSQMLGHKVQQYAITLTSSVLSQSAISGQMWAAPDLPTPPSLGYAADSVAAGFGAQMAKVHGLPLAYSLVYKGTPMGDISVSSTAISLSQTPLAASLFRIPSTYSQGTVQTAQQMPSAGFPLGDGLPLDVQGGAGTASAGAAGANADASALSGGSMQQLMSSLSGLLGSVAPSGEGSGGDDSGAASGGLSGALGASGLGGNLSSLVSPQMIQQMTSELQSLLNADGSN